ncbi:MAG: Uma2 family endonuclease [Actinomycetota bacterium]
MAVRPVPKVFHVEEYEGMYRAGVVPEDDRLELINGTIIQMTPIGDRHAESVGRLTMILAPRLSGRAIVWVQNPVNLSDLSQPQPDLSVLSPRGDFYGEGKPRPADTLLLIEVADSSLDFDRSVKAPLYAATGVPELWIVDVGARAIEVYRVPGPDGYAERRILVAGQERIAPEAFRDVEVSVEDVFGAQR